MGGWGVREGGKHDQERTAIPRRAEREGNEACGRRTTHKTTQLYQLLGWKGPVQCRAAMTSSFLCVPVYPVPHLPPQAAEGRRAGSQQPDIAVLHCTGHNYLLLCIVFCYCTCCYRCTWSHISFEEKPPGSPS